MDDFLLFVAVYTINKCIAHIHKQSFYLIYLYLLNTLVLFYLDNWIFIFYDIIPKISFFRKKTPNFRIRSFELEFKERSVCVHIYKYNSMCMCVFVPLLASLKSQLTSNELIRHIVFHSVLGRYKFENFHSSFTTATSDK